MTTAQVSGTVTIELHEKNTGRTIIGLAYRALRAEETVIGINPVAIVYPRALPWHGITAARLPSPANRGGRSATKWALLAQIQRELEAAGVAVTRLQPGESLPYPWPIRVAIGGRPPAHAEAEVDE